MKLVCTLTQAREGCIAIADHVILLCNSSEAIRVRAGRLEKPTLLRYSYILTLVALEEAGKLFELWQAASESEQNHPDEVVVDGWRDHKKKGGKAGDLCCQMLEFVSNLEDHSLDRDEWNGLRDGIAESRQHLSEIYPRFREERVLALYVDLIDSKWTAGSSPSTGTIEVDNLLLGVIARTAHTYLGLRDSRFSIPVRLLSQIKNRERSDDTREFIEMVFSQVVLAAIESIAEHDAEVHALCE